VTPDTVTATSREEQILENLPQVRLIARRIAERLPGHVHVEDLISSGTLGLIAAIDRYDGTQGVKLRTYAEYKIRGAILDSLRELDWAPRRQRRRARAIREATSVAEQRHLSTVSTTDVATELGIPLDQCHQWMADLRNLAFTSLDSLTVDADGHDVPRQIATNDELPNRGLEREQLQKILTRALNRMPSTERMVLNLYYHENLTLREISRVMGVHESRVSQLKIQALARLRVVIEKQWPQRGGLVQGRQS
jgi:RNA polymerase sigma factor for flagellar operon FliA